MGKQKLSYDRFGYIWLHTAYRSRHDLNSIITLWYLGKDHITFSNKKKKERFHATAFESAISLRDAKTANEVIGYLDQNSNYFKLAKSFIWVFLEPDIDIPEIMLADKPYPYYMYYLFPMCQGIIADGRNEFDNAIAKHNLAIKKVPSGFADWSLLDSKINDIHEQILSAKRKKKNQLEEHIVQ